MDAVAEGGGSKQKEWTVQLQINNSTVAFKLDTGAQVNIISETEFNKLKPRPKLHAAKLKVTGYSGANILVKGKCAAKIRYKDKEHSLSFVVVPKDFQAILGLSACEKLHLVKSMLVVEESKESEPEYDSILREYEDVFKGLGCLSGEHAIQVDETVPPVIHPCRKVPFALQRQFKKGAG